jgi:hypothetical protein
MYPQWQKASSDREEVLGMFMESDLVAITAHAELERAAGHDPRPVMIELVQPDGALRYEVVDGPRCDHMCSRCRQDIDQGMAEFGDGAIGVFNDSSGGEMERLRRELRQLAATMSSAVNSINARLPGQQHARLEAENEIAHRAERKTLQAAGVVKIPMREMHHSQGVEKVEAIIADPEGDDAER